ncbi:hypothetical protein JKY72_00605 [Candidatus Gracilibacteria bacterium]|nr:hypothetical protein [Candidatus Gracilibacteria bacterium]
MKVIVLTYSGHLGANYILTHLPKNKDIEIVGIINRSTRWPQIKKRTKRLLLISGILVGLRFLVLFASLSIAAYLKRVFSKKRRILDADEVAKIHNIPYHDVLSVNSKSTLEIIKKLKPDLLISNHFEQIIEKPLLQIPKIGTINIHPGILPKYGGIFPYFWKLLNREKHAGVTIHWMTEKLDDGEIIGIKRFKIKKADTAVDLLHKSSKVGLKLLNKTLRKIKKGTSQSVCKKGRCKCYTLPTLNQFREFQATGRRLFSFKKLAKYF